VLYQGQLEEFVLLPLLTLKKVENPLLDNYSVNLDIVLFLVQATKANPFNWSQIRSLKQLLNGQWEAQS
jgi:hypothetical protein